MYCQATTGFFIVRRCRGRGISRCQRCSMVFCDDHFDRSVEQCLSCIEALKKIEQDETAVPQEQDGWGEESDRWDNDTFYYGRTYNRSHRDRSYPVEESASYTDELAPEDFEAFEEIQYFDRDAERATAYDS